MTLKENDIAPDFSLPDQNEKPINLKNYLGKWVVIYFYPKDDTPGCTTEAVDFTKLSPEFSKLGATILGISKDTCESHRKFINDKKLEITLLSDTEAGVLKKYGVWQLRKLMGKEFMGIARTTFIIDPKGKIWKILGNVNPTGHAHAVLEEIRKKQEQTS